LNFVDSPSRRTAACDVHGVRVPVVFVGKVNVVFEDGNQKVWRGVKMFCTRTRLNNRAGV
jgi:hypothetical protein